MNWKVVQRILGLFLCLFSVTMLPPVLFSAIFRDGSWVPFLEAFVVTLAAGLALWLPVRNYTGELRLRDGFLVVSSFWIVLGTFGAIPFLFSHDPVMSFTDAVFESISGLTTTGATVLTQLEGLPKSILYYRQQLQWLGGMGIIVLAVAILPMLGVGGMQLYRAETPGPIKDTKLTPRVTETAKALWYLYLAFTVLCALAYLIVGMSWFDAICHAYSTVSIGGFSPHDLNMGYFGSMAVELVAVVFMFIAGINFSLHFFTWRNLRFGHYRDNPEFRAYVVVLSAVSLIVVGTLLWNGTFETTGAGIVNGLFTAVSIATTTGFTIGDFSGWPGALPVLLIFASFIGGSAGSTGGGIKVIRWFLIYKQGVREVIRLVHPTAALPVKVGRQVIPDRVVDAVWGFFSVYIIVFGVMMLGMLATGLDQVSAFAAVAASLNNLGPGLGEVTLTFRSVESLAKWIAVAGMLLGRLEIFTLLVLFTPAFWRR